MERRKLRNLLLIVMLFAGGILIGRIVEDRIFPLPKKESKESLSSNSDDVQMTSYLLAMPGIAPTRNLYDTWLCYLYFPKRPLRSDVEKVALDLQKKSNELSGNPDSIFSINAYDEPEELKDGRWVQLVIMYTETKK